MVLDTKTDDDEQLLRAMPNTLTCLDLVFVPHQENDGTTIVTQNLIRLINEKAMCASDVDGSKVFTVILIYDDLNEVNRYQYKSVREACEQADFGFQEEIYDSFCREGWSNRRYPKRLGEPRTLEPKERWSAKEQGTGQTVIRQPEDERTHEIDDGDGFNQHVNEVDPDDEEGTKKEIERQLEEMGPGPYFYGKSTKEEMRKLKQFWGLYYGNRILYV